ncbi:MAG TPA: hypothetical protein VMU01_01455 [Rhizomicrobium sp.]|nr:hypothetical protein [Rhizomicrobium sp.]
MDNRYLVITLLAAAVALGGCDGKPKQQEQKLPGLNMKVQVDATHSVTMGVKLPGNMPPYAQVYAGADVKSVVDLSSAGFGYVITYEAPAQPEEVLDFYRKNAAAAGLQTQDDSRVQNAFNFAAHKDGTTERMSVTLAAKDGGTFVQLRYS